MKRKWLLLAVLLVACASPENHYSTEPAPSPQTGTLIFDDGEYRIMRVNDGPKIICYIAEQYHLRVAPALSCLW